MKLKILGSESLGVRGLSCIVEVHSRSIVIDPGLALGYLRHGLLPHPFQVAVGENVRQEIVKALKNCTDIVISHFHGDHIPLPNANPYQLSAQKITQHFRKPRLWCKSVDDLSPAMAKRWRDLSQVLRRRLTCSENQKDDFLDFSKSMPHGEFRSRMGTVMMTRVRGVSDVFVHASDVQLLDDVPIKQILAWKPDIVFASGPPLYLRHLSMKKRKKAQENALILAQEIPILILDHHMLRNEEGYRMLDDLSASAGHKIYCAADYMERQRLPLEAWRKHLYREMPVPEGWHKAYALGKADTIPYRKWRGMDIQEMGRIKKRT
jgi:predicted metallo-beta-lactamase superfamily hydrolase